MALNEQSRRIVTTDLTNLGVDLLPHQRALVYRILDIESRVVGTPNAFAMMSDKPGAGKTFVALAAIYISNQHIYKRRSLNVIVVPYNIHSQWQAAIQRIFPPSEFATKLRYKSISQYADILDAPTVIREGGADIILTTSLYFSALADHMKAANITAHRVFFDEADTISNLLQVQMDTKMTWFISASMSSIFPKDPEAIVKVGKYELNLQHLLAHNAYCDPEFINRNIALEPPKIHIIPIENAYSEFLTQQSATGRYQRSLDQIAALDFAPCKYTEDPFPFDTEQTAFETCLLDATIGQEQITQDIIVLEAEIKEAQKTGPLTADPMYQRLAKLKHELERCKTLASRAAELSIPSNQQSKQQCKLHVIQNIIKLRTSQVQQGHAHAPLAILIYTDHDRLYKWLRIFLEANRISFKDLDGGNIKSMDAIIHAYKQGRFTVLLADSSMYSCGMNLENTTDIIFVHKMTEYKEKQVIGRAQRYGRTTSLHVWKLAYAFE